MRSLHKSLIFYLRGIACGFTMVFCLHESVDVQHTAYRHTPTNPFEAGKIAVAVYFLAVVLVSQETSDNRPDEVGKQKTKKMQKNYNCEVLGSRRKIQWYKPSLIILIICSFNPHTVGIC